MPAQPSPTTRLAELLLFHKRAGTRADGTTGRAWSDASLGTKAGYAPNTILNWRTGKIVPDDISALCGALFGNRHPNARAEFEAAWQEARGVAAPPPPRVPKAATTRARPRRALNTPPSPFRITDRLDIDGLVEFKVHPTPGNSDETFRIDATLSFGILAYDYNGTAVEIALTDAEIAFTSTAYQHVQGSRVCDRTDHEWLKPRPGGGIGVDGPRRSDALYGDPLGSDHLAVMERVADHESPITVEIRARAAKVRTEAQAQGVTVNRQAVIDAILGEGERKDAMGRLVFARARIHRRTPT